MAHGPAATAAAMKNRIALAAAALVVVFACMGVTEGSEEPCTPGQVKMKDCNTCRCTATGIWGCTRMACPHPEKDDGVKVAVKREARQCVPNTTFRQECNTCTCNSDGSGAICTLKACLSRSRRELVCTPGTIFKRGCNLCHCKGDGRSAVCIVNQCLGRDQ